MAWQLTIENIAGIRKGEARIEPGVNAVRASNWQGKSSFLSAIETAFGTETPLTEGEEHGRVELATDDGTYTVDLERSNGRISRSGEPYLSDTVDRVCAELFAFLDETNEIRQAVRVGDNLEELLTRPLDFENIDEQIGTLQAERNQVETELDRARDAANRLPKLQETVTTLEADLDNLQEEWDELEQETVEDNDARDQLSTLRAQLEQTKADIDRYESTADRIEQALEENHADLEALEIPTHDDLKDELEALHDELRDIERDKELLQSIHEVNQRVLDEDRVALLTDVSHEMLTDSVACWLCGDETTRDSIEARLTEIKTRVETLRRRETDLQSNVEDLEEKQRTARQAERKERDLKDRIGELEPKLADAQDNLQAARERRTEIEDQIDALADEVRESEDRATDLKSEIKYTETELADAQENLEQAEAEANQRDVLQEEYDSLTEEIQTLRTRKERIKRETRTAFSAALDDLTGRFDVGFETARLTDSFDLVVARDGREASLNALSEGERELLGVIAALAGHEGFNVVDRLPIMLLDGHTGLDNTSTHHLVNYLTERVDVLVLSTFPEYESFDGNELSPADWQTVSFGDDDGGIPS